MKFLRGDGLAEMFAVNEPFIERFAAVNLFPKFIGNDVPASVCWARGQGCPLPPINIQEPQCVQQIKTELLEIRVRKMTE